MKQLTDAVLLFCAYSFLIGYSSSGFSFDIAGFIRHPENNQILVKKFETEIGIVLCFNNDGQIDDLDECDGSPVDEGLLWLDDVGDWGTSHISGINWCGTNPESPVSGATCPWLDHGQLGSCTPYQWNLVQTTMSGHFWAVQGNTDCSGIERVEPCMSTGSFLAGCSNFTDKTGIDVKGSYIQSEVTKGQPPHSHCVNPDQYGRMAVDAELEVLWICTEGGWVSR
jgi:hypothetical protein